MLVTAKLAKFFREQKYNRTYSQKYRKSNTHIKHIFPLSRLQPGVVVVLTPLAVIFVLIVLRFSILQSVFGS